MSSLRTIYTTHSGTYSYLDAGGEQTVVELSDGSIRVLFGGWIDTDALTQNGTFKIYYKADGTNYREADSIAFTAGTNIIFLDSVYGIHYDFKITYTESVDEGAARSLEYDFVVG